MANTLSLKLRLIGLSTLLGLIIIIQASVVINANHQVLAQTNKINQIDIPLLNYAHELKLSVVQVQQWLTDISATRGLDGLNDGFDEAENNAKLFKELIIKIKALDADHARDYDQMSFAFDGYYQAGKNMAQAYIDKGPAGGNVTMASFDAAAEAIYSKVDPLLERVKSDVNAAQTIQNEEVGTSKNFALMGAIIVVVMLLFITFNMIISIRRLPQIVEEMASSDLNKRYHVSGNTEISQITHSLQIMRERLLDMIDNTSDSIREISKESENIAELTDIANKNIHEQFSQREHVATAMNEMAISTQEVANTISLTSDAAKEANDLTENGQVIVDETTIQIKALATQIDDASETIHQLEQDSVSITGVLNVIRSIAEQTNLLALNAAIEAARAGEQGRGFAVVADEVRTLASRTQQSTEEVDVMLDKLLQGSKNAVEVMSKSKEQAESAVNKVSETGDSLSKISGAVETIYDMSAQIATSAGQQSAVAEDINQKISSISDISNDSLQHIENLDSSAHELASKSMMLKDIVEKFNKQ